MIKKLSILWVSLFWVAATTYGQLLEHQSFHAPTYEGQCMNYFNDTASGVNNVNAFILAKMTELMYLERLDYQMRYIGNSCQPVDTISSTDAFRANSVVTDSNFQTIYTERFKHYFNGKLETEKEHEAHQGEEGTEEHICFKYIQKIHTHTARFLGIKYKSGLDPELMIISTPKTIFILFRGTDDVGKNKWAEWLGTDFRINQTPAGGALVGTRIHTGFWLSFDLIRDELIETLIKFNAKKKNIWLAGHSLGAALSIVTGTYLKSYGFDVQNVYAYACPRTIGNKAFIRKTNELLPHRIQRFEYFKDPVTLLWAPGFKYDYVGERNWYDEEKKGNYKLYKNTGERVVVTGPFKRYPYIDLSDRKEARRIRRNQLSGTICIGMGMLHYHNPQWYVKAAYKQLSEEEKEHLPKVDDSYPYLYYGRKDSK
ncbi:lipase family protein [Aureispira anguillae]|uniref:Lipase family protein n=1 Tax=Aureispira anguillae TaxID=2864201 RepID=A0A916DWT8_9BACT|nr:lipase family protein [Aureispira anguillae]BDS15055.1 lipase family protein [Aureispira anguillae]